MKPKTFFAAAIYASIVVSIPTDSDHQPKLSNTHTLIEKFGDLTAFSGESVQLDRSDIGDILEAFVGHLKSFIHDPKVDFRGLDLHSAELKEQLADIGDLILESDIVHSGDLKQFMYAEHMFKVMVESSDLLRSDTLKDAQDQRLTFKTINLNVRLFRYFDSHGQPDRSLDDFEEQVFQLMCKLNSWEQRFVRLNGPNVSTQILFVNQLIQARNALLQLGGHIRQQAG